MRVDEPRPTGLADAASIHATLHPARLALVAGEVRLTWEDLDAAVERAVDRLAESEVRAGDRVALLAAPSVEAVVALHALARLGAVAAPLGIRLTPSESAAAIDLLRPVLVVHDRPAAATAAMLGTTLLLDRLADASGSIGRRRQPSTDASAPALAVSTSGTTGRPKIALLSHRALAASASSWSAFLPPAAGWLLCLGLAHVAGLGVVWRAALDGVPLVVLPAFEPAGVLAAMSAAMSAAMNVAPGPTHVSLVPTQLARLLDAAGGGSPPASLRAVLLGGGVIPPRLVLRAIDAGWPVVPTYGLTETASGATALATAEAARHPESAGGPLPGVELRIERAGRDGVGEILVRTPSAFSGYLGDRAATAAAFMADGWLRTGDLGRLDPAGRLIVVDRRTDLIVSGGENVAPAEVEAVLVAHPAVVDAGVVGRPDEEWGAIPVAAIVVARRGDDPTDEELRAFCRERLASYKVPAAFTRLASLPRTSSGKLQRARLRDELLAAMPAMTDGDAR